MKKHVSNFLTLSIDDMRTKKKHKSVVRKNIFACLFSVHNTISLSCHEQVCLTNLFC